MLDTYSSAAGTGFEQVLASNGLELTMIRGEKMDPEQLTKGAGEDRVRQATGPRKRRHGLGGAVGLTLRQSRHWWIK